MTRHFYHERDYAFGQAMLKLRTSIGLTQAGLADLLGVSRCDVSEWLELSLWRQRHLSVSSSLP